MTRSDYLTVTTRDATPDVTVVTVDGEVDFGSLFKLRGCLTDLLRKGRVRLVFDLSKMSFCDSGGLGFFIDAHGSTRDRGGWCRLAGVSARVYELFKMLSLDRLLSFYPTVDAAVSDHQLPSSGDRRTTDG